MQAWQAGNTGVGAAAPAPALLQGFMLMARKADYKLRGIAKNGFVGICGHCVGINQLGNIIYGVVASMMNLVDQARKYGRGTLTPARAVGANGPTTNWQKLPGKEEAFNVGVNLQKNPAQSLCDAMKQANLPQLQYDVNGMQPCPAGIFNPEHTDFSTAPLSNPSGN
jgi:hypothetical protein